MGEIRKGRPYSGSDAKLLQAKLKELYNSSEAISGVPIDESHRFTDPIPVVESWILQKWVRWFIRREVPHVVVDIPEIGSVIFKHMWKGGQLGSATWKAGFCCGSLK